MIRPDVEDASTASVGTTGSSRAYSSRLVAIRSGAFSWMNSAFATASSAVVQTRQASGKASAVMPKRAIAGQASVT
jgi:hypothetical protein